MKTMRLFLFAIVLVNVFALYHCREAPLTVEDEQEKMNLMSIDEIMAGGGLCKMILKCFTDCFCCEGKCYRNLLECKNQCGARGSSPGVVDRDREGVQGGDNYSGRSTNNGGIKRGRLEKLPNISRNRNNYLWSPPPTMPHGEGSRISGGSGLGGERMGSQGDGGGGGRGGGVGFGGVDGGEGGGF